MCTAPPFLGKEVSSGFDMDFDLVAPDNPRQYAPAIAEWARLYHETNNHRTLYVPTNPSKNPEAPNYFAPEVDSSIIDANTVRVKAPTEENRYYVLTFSEDLQQAQRSENKEDRLNAAFSGRMDNLTIKKADFMAEIWECGLFRQIRIEFLVNAKING